MNIFQLVMDKLQKGIVRRFKPTPADFRRGYRAHRIIGYKPDTNSKHVGIFAKSITPMHRRFKGVARTTGK